MLKFKRMGEQELERSGLPYTLVRPNRLTDGAWVPGSTRCVIDVIDGAGAEGALMLTGRSEGRGDLGRLRPRGLAGRSLHALPERCPALSLLFLLCPNELALSIAAAGPYTSYDLNTLLKGTAGVRQDVQLSAADDLTGEASRIAVAGEAGGEGSATGSGRAGQAGQGRAGERAGCCGGQRAGGAGGQTGMGLGRDGGGDAPCPPPTGPCLCRKRASQPPDHS